jgi:hypothetical protein
VASGFFSKLLDPYGRSSPVRNSIEGVLDIPAFLRRKAN